MRAIEHIAPLNPEALRPSPSPQPECQPNLSRTEYLYMFSMPCRVNNQLRCNCPTGYFSCPSGANT